MMNINLEMYWHNCATHGIMVTLTSGVRLSGKETTYETV
jgi:hypothetical protein